MPIEGPLQELALPDVFQLLDLSRKTGTLRVVSRTRDDEGMVYFNEGRIIQAALRSKPAAAVDSEALTPRELERKRRGQIEGVIFDLMNWREGFFTFEERSPAEFAPFAPGGIATESLLMESARRIDEWSRIADKIPHLGVVPALSDLPEDHETQLDLLPHEWAVLSLIDGDRDIRAIAIALGRAEFEAAKVVYGLITTGVVEIIPQARNSIGVPMEPEPDPEIRDALERGLGAVRAGNFATARESLERFLALAPDDEEAPRARAALAALSTLMGALDGGGHG